VLLLRSCAGVMCQAGESCGPSACTPIDVPGTDWPPFSGSVLRLDAGAPRAVDAPVVDRAPVVDSPVVDSPMALDTSSTVDAPQVTDSPTMDRFVDVASDGPVAVDARLDGGMDAAPLDSVAPIDAPVDAGLVPDSPQPTDVSPVADRGVSEDAPTIVDTPTIVDVPPLDAGCSSSQPCPGALTCCGGACVDTSFSSDHCGMCNRRCALPSANAECSDGDCVVASCAAGFGDCDRVIANGCETRLNSLSHCSICGAACAARPHSAPVCRATGCGFTCDVGYGDCNGDPADGCEVNLQTSQDHCGACGFACDVLPFAPGMCSTGTCRNWCVPGRGDCDGNAANGCETDLRTSTSHCGRCGNGCPTGACAAGLCPAEVDVSAGGANACARRPSGDVLCWGANYNGQIGNGRTGTSQTTPAGVVGVSDAVETACGLRFCCARRASGRVSCWGENTVGQLGNGGSGSAVTSPVDVSGLTDAASIALGDSFGCARRAGGQVVCWGDNGSGQLGDGTMVSRSTAMAVTGLPAGVQQLSAGALHICARTGGGHVWCWGNNQAAQLGDGSLLSRSTPVEVIDLSDAIVIAGAYRHTCAVRVTGGVVCWGDNSTGTLGDGSRTRRTTPVAVMGLTDATSVAARSAGFTCALRAGGTVVCWGSNNTMLGIGFSSADALVPGDTVVGLTDAISITAGLGFSCARRRTGAIACWGRGPSGELGNGANWDSNTPVLVSGLP